MREGAHCPHFTVGITDPEKPGNTPRVQQLVNSRADASPELPLSRGPLCTLSYKQKTTRAIPTSREMAYKQICSHQRTQLLQADMQPPKAGGHQGPGLGMEANSPGTLQAIPRRDASPMQPRGCCGLLAGLQGCARALGTIPGVTVIMAFHSCSLPLPLAPTCLGFNC